MATHDYVIDNSTGANVRADINLVLQAILTNNSSSSAPSTTAAYMWWADTTNGVLKIRNSSNNDWVELLQLDGTLTLEDGSASTPGLAFRDDLNTGIFSSAADTFNVATAGVERLELKASETVFNEDGADTDFRVESDTNANFFKIDAGSEQASFGGAVTASGYTLEVIRSTTEAYANATDSTLRLNNTNTSANDNQASLHFSVSTTSTGADAAIVAQAEDSSGNSRLEFYTDDANVLGEKMVIDSSGNVGIGTTSPTGLLHLKSDSAETILKIESESANDATVFIDTSDGSGATADVRFARDGSTKGRISFLNSGSTQGDMRFTTGSDSEAMRIDSSGNLGLGTTSPLKKLHIADAGDVALMLQTTNAVDDKEIFEIGCSANASNHADLVFRTRVNAGTGGSELMRLTNDGPHLLLGGTSDVNEITESSANAGMVIGGTGFGNGGLAIINSTSGTGRIYFGDAIGSDTARNRGQINYSHSQDAMIFAAAGTEAMRLDSSQRLLIGTSTAFDTASGFAKLQIDGSGSAGLVVTGNSTGSQTRISFFNPNGRVGFISTDGSATVYNTSGSDKTLKKNFESWTENTLDLFKNINPQKFNYIHEDDGAKKSKGFIAQEMVSSFPEAYTKEDKKDAKYYFNPSGMVVYLMKAIQELEAKVAALEAA